MLRLFLLLLGLIVAFLALGNLLFELAYKKEVKANLLRSSALPKKLLTEQPHLVAARGPGRG